MPLDNAVYRTVIKVKQGNTVNYYEADLLKEPQEHLGVDVTQQPMVNGDMVADHRVIQPTTVSLSGKFSLNGSTNTPFGGGRERLANIEQTFEDIMKNGVKCDIVVISKNDKNEYSESSLKFLPRKNMILNSIDWSRGYNFLQFTFGFVEAQVINVDIVDWVPDVRDSSLPALTEPQVLDFTETLLDYEQIDSLVLKMMNDCGLFEEGFLEMAATVCDNAAKVELGISIGSFAVSGVIATALLVAAGASATIPVAGWILAGTLALAGAIAYGLSALFSLFTRESNKKVYKIKQFKLYKTDRENQAEVERLVSFIGSIHQQLEQLENVLSLYKITVNEAQECMLYIDDNYYIFNFEQNYATNKSWSLKVNLPDETLVAERKEVTGLSNITECTTSNALFRTRGIGSYVYLLNTKQAELAMNGRPQSEIDEAANDLSNYFILISRINMEQYTQVLTDIIKNAIEA